MTPFAADVFRPTERYLSELIYLKQRAAPGFRFATARTLLEQARRAAGQPAKRFRVIKDVAALLQSSSGLPEQSVAAAESLPPSREEALALSQLVGALRNDPTGAVPPDLLEQLNELVEETQRSTWSSFEEFERSGLGRRSFGLAQSLDDLEAFDEWFAQALPALGLVLPDDDDACQAALDRRVEFLLAKIAPDNHADVFGLRERYDFEAWAYVRRLIREPETAASA